MLFDTAKSVTEIWVTKTDTYTSKSTGEIYANVQAISAIPPGSRGNAKGYEITEYPIEPTLLDDIVFVDGDTAGVRVTPDVVPHSPSSGGLPMRRSRRLRPRLLLALALLFGAGAASALSACKKKEDSYSPPVPPT